MGYAVLAIVFFACSLSAADPATNSGFELR